MKEKSKAIKILMVLIFTFIILILLEKGTMAAQYSIRNYKTNQGDYLSVSIYRSPDNNNNTKCVYCGKLKTISFYEVTAGSNGGYDESVKIPATCDLIGGDAILCAHRCGTGEGRRYWYFISSVQNALGHDFDMNSISWITEPTCTTPGKGRVKCTRCSVQQEKNVPSFGGHTYAPVETVEPTCLKPGYVITKCTKCGERRDQGIGSSSQGTTWNPNNYHKYKWGYCEICKKRDPNAGCSHTYKGASCTEPEICTKCNITKGEALGHQEVDGICSRCGELINANHLTEWDLAGNKAGNAKAKLLDDGTLLIYSADDPTGANKLPYEISDYTHPTFGNESQGEICVCPITGKERIKKVRFLGAPKNIGSYLFYYCSNIEEVIIDNPEGIEYIGSGAFFGCKKIKEFTIPVNVTMIGARAFCHCHDLKTLDFANAENLIRIGHEVARDCYSLEKVTLPEGLKVIGYEAFLNCIALKDVFIPTTVVAMGTTGNANSEKGLGSSNQITDIQKEQGNTLGYNNIFTVDFSRNQGQTEYISYVTDYLAKNGISYNQVSEALKEVTKLLTKTRVWYYSSCEIANKYDAQQATTEMEISELKWNISKDNGDNVIATLDKAGKLTIAGNGKIKDYSKENNTPWYDFRDKIKSVEIQEGVTDIGSYLFYNHANIETIKLTNTITSIGSYAFSNCTSLKTINIPEGVTIISNGTFNDCWKLESINFAGELKSIGIKAFFNCISLTNIMIPWETYIEKDSNAFGVDKEGNCAKLVISYYEDSEMMSAYANNSENKIANREYRAIKVKNIKVNELYETNYYEKEELNKEELVVEVTYEDNYVREVFGNSDNVQYSKTTLDTVGEHTITITYYNKITSIKVNVSHKFDNGVVTKEATCIEEGEIKYTCTICKETLIETEEKLEHDFSEEYTTDKKATCKEAGSESRHCTRTGCNEKTDVREIPASGNHTWDNGKVTKAATCTEDGVKTYTCTICKETKTSTTEKLGHNFSEEYTIDKQSTCKEAGSKSRHCTRTGCNEKTDVKTIPVSINHTWDNGKVTKAETCTENGIKTYTCTVCKETKTETIEKTGHNFENGECTNCEEVQPEVGVESDEYTVDSLKYYILSIQPETTVREFKQKLETNATKKQLFNNGNAVGEDELVVTGMKLKLSLNDEVVEFTLIVKGDVNSDGYADFKDIATINKHRLEKNIIEEGYLLRAANVEEDEEVDFKDIVKINKFRLEKITKL